MKLKTQPTKIVNTWIGLSVLAIGITITFGSFFNIQNDKIFTIAALIGLLTFLVFLIKSLASKYAKLDGFF